MSNTNKAIMMSVTIAAVLTLIITTLILAYNNANKYHIGDVYITSNEYSMYQVMIDKTELDTKNPFLDKYRLHRIYITKAIKDGYCQYYVIKAINYVDTTDITFNTINVIDSTSGKCDDYYGQQISLELLSTKQIKLFDDKLTAHKCSTNDVPKSKIPVDSNGYFSGNELLKPFTTVRSEEVITEIKVK